MPDCRSVSISSRSDCDDYCDKLDGGLVAWFDSFGFWQCECVVPGGWDTDKKSWDSWEMTFRCSGSRMIEKKLINNRIRCVTRATSELHTGTAESARHQPWTSLKEKADSSDNFIHGTKRDISTVNRLQGVLTWIGGCGRRDLDIGSPDPQDLNLGSRTFYFKACYK